MLVETLKCSVEIAGAAVEVDQRDRRAVDTLHRTLHGDGRLLVESSTKTFDLIVIDCFSSDSLPVHLLTVEAFNAALVGLGLEPVSPAELAPLHAA